MAKKSMIAKASRDPKFEVRGYRLSVRRSEAARVEVEEPGSPAGSH